MYSPQDTLLTVTGLSKSYEQGGVKTTLLNALDLHVRRGETIAILGVSGTGKSTLLNLLAGLDQADAGHICVNGLDLSSARTAERARYRREQIGFVFQFYHLLPTLTALENVLSGWEAAGLDRKQGPAAAQAMLAALDLAHKAHLFPDQLSGGEQQRVAIARALVKRPTLLLADEPTGNLDPKTALQASALLLQHARQHAGATLIVTHNPALGTHTDRTLVLRDGRLAAPEQPVHHPTTPSMRPTGLIA